MDKSVKVILDTDIGTDIDDAVALAYLLKNPRCQLLGITTVTGEPEKRAMLAAAICDAADVKVPIHAGSAIPFSDIPQRQNRASHARLLDQDECLRRFPPDSAIEFLQKTIRQHPGEISLLTIGPLTNIAQLYTRFPDIPELIDVHYMMGGAYTEVDKPEWNILCDPVAAKIVLEKSVRPVKAYGLDVTMQVRMQAELVKRRFKSPILSSFMDSIEIFFDEQKRDMIFHDPLAAASIFKQEICRMQRGNIEVIENPEDRFGKTQWTPAANGKHEIAVEVMPYRFFEEFFDKTS